MITSKGQASSSLEGKPTYLYRYCSGSRGIQILRDHYLYLCAPNSFNDMFEGSTGSVIDKKSSTLAREVTIRTWLAEGVFPTRAEVEEYVDEFESPQEQADCYSQFAEILDENVAKMREHSGISCLSEYYNHQKMWGTYGDNHTGMCIQFWHDGGNSIIHNHALPVIYSNEKWAELLVEELGPNMELSAWQLACLVFLRKTTVWADEAERRILMLADSHQTRQERQLPFPTTNIRRVFLGPRCSKEHRGVVNELATLHGWNIFDMQCDPSTGISSVHGLGVVRSFEDFEWHFMREQIPAKLPNIAVNPRGGSGGF